MTGPLEDRVAIVTGAATGIGRAIAHRLAADGATVIVNHLDTPAEADVVCQEINAAGGVASPFAADISLRAEHAALVAAALDRHGRWDILVANAAVAPTRPLIDFTEDDVDRVLAVNVKGLIWGLQLAGAHLADGGRIVALSSSTTGLHQPGYTVYDASKGAVDQLVRIFAHEIGARTITCNAVAPGATATETYVDGRGEELVQRFASMSAFDRLGTPEEIADVVAFLAGDRAGWITGQIVRANGGTV
jgi:3-oxoacyl-[acyl-carrier protein] reductase